MIVGRRIAAVVLILLAAIVQVSIMQRIQIGAGTPDVVTLVVTSTALLTDSVTGTLAGFFAGLAVAACAATALGPEAFVGAIIGYWAGRWGETIVAEDHPLPPVLAGVAGTLVMAIGRPLVTFLLTNQSDMSRTVWSGALLTALIAVVLVLPVHALVRRVLGAGSHRLPIIDAGLDA